MEYLLATVVTGAAFAQALTGIGFGLVCAPAFVAVLGPVEGVAATALLAAFVNVAVVVTSPRDVDVRAAGLLLLPALLATPLAALALREIDETVATAAAGVLVLAGVGLLVARPAVVEASPVSAGPGVAAAGAVSGAMNAAAGVGGPAAALYVLARGMPPARMRATLQAYLLGVNVVTVAALGVVSLRLEWPLALVAGTVAGVAVASRLPERAARDAVLLVAAAGGVVLLARAAL
ncbi:MAG TPA: TSUP family transporter [Thermoleophilaceae bacterium]|nr:TSUP family transporter [Thermoleophilaceae bacterium]